MKTKLQYLCTECGHVAPKWMGRCPECSAWNTLEEQTAPKTAKSTARPAPSTNAPIKIQKLGEIPGDVPPRYRTGWGEFDRVLGGGLVPGSLVLVAGDPGIGKSTLLLQAGSAYAEQGLRVLVVAAEESADQLRMRCVRLGSVNDSIQVLAGNRLDEIGPLIGPGQADVIIVDSVQTLHYSEGPAPGSAAQVRDSALFFLELAKNQGVPVFLIGHVTKEGTVAGPRVVEHLVDAVVMLEGDRFHPYRVLRASKNRFGPTHEVGLFEMGEGGMVEVDNPSAFLLEDRRGEMIGSTVVPSLEGTRPILLEVQALVGRSGGATPRRVATGLDSKRLAVLLAVLERRVGLATAGLDVFVNIAGGFRVAEPAVDLAMAVAVASSAREQPVDHQTVFIGEVGLGGEVRRVAQLERRLAEASKLGFRRAVIPSGVEGQYRPDSAMSELELIPVSRVDEALEKVLGVGMPGGLPAPAGAGTESR